MKNYLSDKQRENLDINQKKAIVYAVKNYGNDIDVYGFQNNNSRNPIEIVAFDNKQNNFIILLSCKGGNGFFKIGETLTNDFEVVKNTIEKYYSKKNIDELVFD